MSQPIVKRGGPAKWAMGRAVAKDRSHGGWLGLCADPDIRPEVQLSSVLVVKPPPPSERLIENYSPGEESWRPNKIGGRPLLLDPERIIRS